MAHEIGYGKLQERLGKQGVYRTATPTLVNDFVGQSEKYVKEIYNKYFPNFSEDGIKSSFDIPLSKLVNGIFDEAKIDPKKPASELSLISRIEYGFLDTKDINNLIGSLSKKGFSKSQVGKVVLAYVLKRIDSISTFAEATNITLSDVDDFENLPPPNKFSTIAQEMVNYGFRNIDSYYDTAADITSYPSGSLLKNRQEFVKRFKKIPTISSKVDRDIARQFFGIQSKEFNYDLKRSEEFKFAFEQGLKYLRYCHQSGTKPVSFANAAEAIATFWKNVRDNIPGLVASHINAITFWGTQLGRNPTDQDLKNLGISRRQFQSMTNHVFDERLNSSEASAFSLSRREESVVGYRGQPERILLNTVKAILQSNQNTLKETGPVSFMILVNDQRYIKIRLPLDATDEMIQSELNINSNYINLSPEERYSLKLDSYKNPKNRSNKFKEIYGFKGSKTGQGDFIVRLTTRDPKSINSDNNSATSMFTVGGYKALIDINQNITSGFEYSIKASHHNFDGVALTSFYDDIFQQIVNQQYDTVLIDVPKIIELSEKRDLVTTKEVLPLPDAKFTRTIKEKYQTTTIRSGKKNQKLSPNVLRALDLAFSNGIDSIHVLYNADSGNNPYSNARFDNVQPVIISIEPLKEILAKFEQDYNAYLKNGGALPTIEPAEKRKVMEYAEMVNNSITWARRGFSTPGVLASPFGAMRNFASKITTSIYENVKLLNQSRGMFSPTLGNNIFDTAQSDVYNPKIDIGNASGHLGVIGCQSARAPGIKPTLEESSIYTVKKSPNQSQKAFRENLVTDPRLMLDAKQQAKVTKILDEVLMAWEKLTFYDLDYKFGNPLVGFFYEDYNSFLKRTLKTLKKDQYLGKNNLDRLGIKDHIDLQNKLNEILMQDAKNTIDPMKIAKTHEMFVAFFEAVNRPTGKTGPLSAR